MDYRLETDGLRALAVLPVILFHAGFPTFSGGFVGVDVFFVISGYLITTIIIAELETGKFSIINFYERRARRILPALFLVVLACLPFAWLWLLPQDMKSFSQSLVSVSAFASNVLFWRTSGYFETAAELKPLLHTWSLAVEEQYYLLFPIFLMLTWRLGKRWMVGLLAVVFAVSLAAAQWGSSARPTPTFYLLPTRGWELLVGAFVAFYLVKNGNNSSAKVSETGGIIGLLLIIYAIFVFDKHTPFPSLYTLVPTIGAALIILFATQRTFVGKLLGNRVFVGIGLISYSAYLWHQPLFAFANHRSLNEPSRFLLGGLAVASLILAFFSWKYVEAPFRDKKRYARKNVFLLGGLFSLFFVLLGLVGHFNDGFKNRVPPSVTWQDLLENPQEPMRNPQCDKSYPQFQDFSACLISKDLSPEVLIIGDSHSQQYYKSLASRLSDKSVMNLAFWSCLPFSSKTHMDAPNGCKEKLLAAHKFAIETPSIKIIYIAGRWGYLASGGFGVDDKHYKLPRRLEQEEASSFLASGVAFLSELSRSGKRIVFIKDIPDLDFNIATCFDMSPFKEGKVRKTCGIRRSVYDERNKEYLALIDRLTASFKNIEVYSPTDLFCDKELCKATLNGLSLYFNSDHLTLTGSDLVVNDLLTKHPVNRPLKNQLSGRKALTTVSKKKSAQRALAWPNG